MFRDRNFLRLVVFGLLFLAACSKHWLTFATGPAALVLDAKEYWEQSEMALQGDWMLSRTPVDYRTPLYPVILGLIRRLFADRALLAAAALQHAIQIGAGLVVAWTCWIVTRSQTCAAVGYALWTSCITQAWFANVMLTETWFTFLLTASLTALIAYHLRPSLSLAAAFGALLGLTILVRPVPQYLGIPLIALFFAPCLRGTPLQTAAVRSTCAAFAVGIVVAPWCLRNWIVFDDVFLARVPAVNKWQVCFQGGSAARLPIPATDAGRQIREALGSDWTGTDQQRYCYAALSRLERTGLSSTEIDELITRACIDAIREQPAAFAWSIFRRMVNYWRAWVRPYPFYSYLAAAEPPIEGQRGWRFEPFASWYEIVLHASLDQHLRWVELSSLLAATGTLALICHRRTRLIGLSLALTFAYFTIVTAALEIENYRYRMVLEPCLIVATVCGWWLWLTPHRSADGRTSASHGAATHS